MRRRKISLDRGEVKISDIDILYTSISTCVSVCLYHPTFKIGGITHISGSRKNDTTPSGRYLKTGGFYYVDKAIPRLLELLKEKHTSIRDKSLELVVVGGLNNEGPISETLSELKEYDFKLIGYDIDQNLHREVRFDTAYEIITVTRDIPFSIHKKIKSKIFYL